MSYLNSILSSIGGNEQAPKTSTVKPPSRTASPLNKPNGPSTNGVTATTCSAPKRKAEDDGQSCGTANKVPRRDAQALPARLAAAASSKPVAKPATNGSSSASSSRPSSAGQSTAMPAIKTTTNTVPAKAPVTPASATAPPKKGSYADMMARAKAAHQANASKPMLGTIQHKPIEKLSAQDKKTRLEQLKHPKHPKQRSNGARSGSRPLSRSQSPAKGGVAAGMAQKSKTASVESGYRGTMRPSAPAAPVYKGTMRGGPAAPKPLPQKAKPLTNRYANYSDEDIDEEEEDYDDLSDMEAGMDEVDEEEAASLALAKREDTEAKREEERLKRDKEQRKKGLQRR